MLPEIGKWMSFVDETIKAIREKSAMAKFYVHLSGGVDSSVAAVMLSKAIGITTDMCIRRPWLAS